MADGTYHTYNMAKCRVLSVLFKNHPNPLTTVDISQITGMDFYKVSRLMNHYSNCPSHYIRRLKIKNGRAFRYKINKKGVRYLTEYVKRAKLGIDLNLRQGKRPVYMSSYTGHKSVRIRSLKDMILTPEQISPYIRINKRGEHELGVTNENKLKIVGLVRNEEEKKLIDEKLKILDEKKKKGKVKGKVKGEVKGKVKCKKATKREKPKPPEPKPYITPLSVSIRLEPFTNKYTVQYLPEAPEKPSEPKVKKAGINPQSLRKNLLKHK